MNSDTVLLVRVIAKELELAAVIMVTERSVVLKFT